MLEHRDNGRQTVDAERLAVRVRPNRSCVSRAGLEVPQEVDVSSRTSPTVRRRRLAIEMRKLREAAGMTMEQVAKELECAASTISRIEAAQSSATPRTIRDILNVYGVTGEERQALIKLSREARQKGWWHQYSDVEPGSYIGLETEAASIRTFEALLVPGLLQIPEYTEAVIRAVRPNLGHDDVRRRAEAREARQALLTGDDPPEFWAVLDEAAVRRHVGSPAVMRQQLAHVAELGKLPHVTVQVVPFEAEAHAGMDGAFTILGYPEPTDRDVVYLENAISGLYPEKPEEIRHYTMLFDHLRAAALKPDKSLALIRRLSKEL